MSDTSLRLVWVYPDLLSTYGDQGNALVVERRARQRGLDGEPDRRARPTSRSPPRVTST